MKKFYLIIVVLLMLPVFLMSQTSSCSLMGDVDGSGGIDIVDALIIAQAYVGLNLANYNDACADVDCSDSVDIVDALLIAQMYVGLISNFPCETTPVPTADTTPPPVIDEPISIACGSTSAVGNFQADEYFSGGSTYNNSNTIDVSQITDNPPSAALFNNERYGAMSYTIPGFTAGGMYAVTLYFAETYLTSTGSRLFNVNINGTPVLTNFDIYSNAGGQNKAIAESFTTTADSNGQIVIQFTAVTENPKINGISIQVGTAPTIGPTAVPAATPVGGQGSTGCGKTSTLTFGSVPGETDTQKGFGDGGYVTIQSGGQTRGFALRLPDNYDKNKTYWVFFGFHWNGGNSKEVDTGGSNGYLMAHYGLQKLSNNNAFFIAPDGLNAGWANTGGRDLTFVDDILKLLEDNYCIDTSHIFTNGFSYGGGMSYALACARANVFRGAAIYEGAQLSGCDGGNDPIALWQMVGLEDYVCTVDMAKTIRDRFVRNNGCIVPAQEPPQPPKAPPYLNPGGHIAFDYTGCSSGHPLRWIVHQSGHGNAIVDGTGDLYNSCGTPPNTCSSSCLCSWVPQDVWTFFSALQ